MLADCLPGAAVTVRVNGAPLTEHATENGDLSASTFVEAVAGAEFDIALHLSYSFAYRNSADRIRFFVSVDGESVRAPILSTRLQYVSEHLVEGPEETRNGVTTLKRLTFAQHASTDKRADDSAIKKLSDVGQIKVTLTRCREAGSDPQGYHAFNFKGVGDHTVPENALKGRSISSHTKLGRAETKPTARYINISYPYGKDPVATYIFQYRTRRDLEIEGIVEREPSPVPLVDRDPDDLTPDELREQNRLLRQKLPPVKIKKEVKREKRSRRRSATPDNDDEDEGGVTFVSETNKRRRMRESMENVEVIDLGD